MYGLRWYFAGGLTPRLGTHDSADLSRSIRDGPIGTGFHLDLDLRVRLLPISLATYNTSCYIEERAFLFLGSSFEIVFIWGRVKITKIIGRFVFKPKVWVVLKLTATFDSSHFMPSVYFLWNNFNLLFIILEILVLKFKIRLRMEFENGQKVEQIDFLSESSLML